MAIGASNRIVVEVEAGLKEQIYAALKARGLTFKEWLIDQAVSDLLANADKKPSRNAGSREK